jgi:hypothetical protein
MAIPLLLSPAAAWGQAQQPYAGLEARSTKALSEKQTADLRAGRGMGLALPAEPNDYPGPDHVLGLPRSFSSATGTAAARDSALRGDEAGGGAPWARS